MGFFQRGLLLYLCLAIAMAFAAPQVIFSGNSPADVTLLSWFSVNYDNSTGDISYVNGSSGLQGDAGTNAAESFGASRTTVTGFLSFIIDGLWQVWSWVAAIFKVLFSPIILLTSPDLHIPTPIIFVFAIPLTFLFIIGLIMWIRGVIG
jgi:hypothetical protein